MSLRPRLMSLLVRPTPPPTWLGVVVAAGCITAETLLVFVLRRLAPENTFGALFLLGVLVVSAGWELRLAVITTLASALAYIYFHLAPNGGFMPSENALAVAIFVPIAFLANALAGQARLRAAEADQRRREAEALAEELTASRVRIVTAADVARRRFERDLHDGAQQRLVSLGLELRMAESEVPADNGELRQRISGIVDGLAAVSEDLREISRGIHPAILSKGGLGAALKVLVRRSPVPVALHVDAEGRFPQSVEVGLYYVAAESLTNAAKYAQASEVEVRLDLDGPNLRLSVTDDGVGGADQTRGSGLIGLRDRIDTLGGTFEISSPAGEGTALRVTVPVAPG